jgi:hypothetical protein
MFDYTQVTTDASNFKQDEELHTIDANVSTSITFVGNIIREENSKVFTIYIEVNFVGCS